jgi:glycosyltransferase involved in cell wall biosynthesis
VNIFFLTETESGCYKWRGAIPAKYLRRRGHNVQILSDDQLSYEAPDVLVIFRTHYPNLRQLVQWCKLRGVRVVFDTDDALDLVPRENLNYRGLRQRMDLYDFLLENADAVTTTTETLADYLREWNPAVTVLPNSVDPEEWSAERLSRGARGEEVRLGWTGSATHFHDLLVALDALREVQRKHPFVFVIQGICEETDLSAFYQKLVDSHGKAFTATPLGKVIRRFLDRLRGIHYEFHPMVPIGVHSRQVCNLALDIGIAPLVEDTFNRHKSCIKYYEYAMSGAVTVASHVLPYSAEVSITAKNSRDAWARKLEWVLTEDRDRLWREQRDWVLEHRSIERTVALWEQLYSGATPVATPPRPELPSTVLA